LGAAPADGPFQFPALADGSADAVTLSTKPASHTLSVGNGSGFTPAGNVTDVSLVCALNSFSVGGAMSGADVNNVSVTCAVNRFTVGGALSGLASDMSTASWPVAQCGKARRAQ
jgi:hypothetical protein